MLDGTFYNINELPGRDMSKIPHPFIVETMELIEKDKNKVFFIHLNHTNPALKQNSLEHKNILKKGFNITKFGQKFHL